MQTPPLADASICYLLADVHLQPDSRHPINQHFLQFLAKDAPKAQQLYILGDLFETWVGDDIGLTSYAEEIQALRSLSDQGTALYIGYGNRDFLMREKFYQACGAQALADIAPTQIQGQSYLLLHGDSLCTDDQAYQNMRRWFHKPWVQWLFLHLPKSTRLKIAQKLRQASGQQSQTKNQQIMDVAPQAVNALFDAFPHINHMIHGHTHRPAHHQFTLHQQTKHRWVLGDWRPEARILKIENGQPGLVDFPTQP